jgi:HPt (histidine-containing phosphotransfer) domain-containing protein
MTQERNRNSQVALNLPELLERVDNDHNLLRELVEIFKQQSPRLLHQLQGEIACGDLKSVENTSHALKGMLSGLSAIRAAEVAARLERLGRGGVSSGLGDAVALLEKEVEQLLPELEASIIKAEP